MTMPLTADVVIAGAGIIGLSVGLELRQRGLSVIVLERRRAMQAASWAAGGMLAAHDPENPPALLPLSLRSLELYPAFLDRIETLAGNPVPLRTHRTLQAVSTGKGDMDRHSFSVKAALPEIQEWIPGFMPRDWNERFVWLEEDSLDPRDVCTALPRAFCAAGGVLREQTPLLDVHAENSGVTVHTVADVISAAAFVDCRGAWTSRSGPGGLPVEPVKGQALTVAIAPERLRCVLRTPEFYAIPRGDGRVTIGATIEHVGFDTAVDPHKIETLLDQQLAQLLPEAQTAEIRESWAGLRPGTPDGLPILGAGISEHCWHATGHYRNGVLLAPGTARVIAQAILGEPTDVPLEKFLPSRFQPHP